MDPFSSEAMVQAQYTSVLNDYSTSDYSASNRLPVQILQYRAQCALRQYDEVIGSISDSDARFTPDLAAVRTYASYLQKPSASAVQEAERLAEKEGDNLSVQLLCGTILARAEKAEQALQLLAKHTGSLDAVALTVQIHLLQNRTDLALQQAKSARSFAQDALLVNLAESWVGMRQGGEQYQKAFYVFEELAQSPASASAMSLVAQAVTELHLGRVEEAETALNAALEMEPENATALANKMVLDAVMGRDMAEARFKLERVEKEHEILDDMRAKRDAFQAAMAKYSPKFEP
ncbi:hypothetical protein LTR91_002765 [Friedmanniomyces endolithicus]|uniref:Coatomer subunit epsilon n=1 Tax=Friedmanniomyces endolithicus TaxID=329885 RepID=A0AAN6G1T5_9PEZI|nr:hypothetical protein LTS09_010534 [Friedmanniomyces endolithicus]KAK0283328.1 hypothetical protein LTR35_006402 [Friedmanniomyces endolithicus]KAK0298593.1 hypothetical protein LTS00_002975 [Friedmanniomyces endolithicus]KAK0310619.1 hypothetical protein LTR01_003773 [Friedmanniomyces endolithicus]KAK0328213.1 hypothetical protein LTR82_000141 [Friedmanniomyces endolithicus]